MFRFTIRDVLWLTLSAALAVGWLVDHAGFEKRLMHAELEWQNATADELEKIQTKVTDLAGKLESRFPNHDDEPEHGPQPVPVAADTTADSTR